MDRRRFLVTAGIGCALLIVLLALVAVLVLVFPAWTTVQRQAGTEPGPQTSVPGAEATQVVVPTFTAPAPGELQPSLTPVSSDSPGIAPDVLPALYARVNPGVVNIRVFVERGGMAGEGAGSGFILDEQGHIVTNNHVVAGARRVTVIFYDGIEAEAEIVGTDQDSDLAVVRVDEITAGAHPLTLADSDEVQVGEWAVAIGNPFSLGGSMTLGIVSAIGRSIPSGVAQFNIPQAIQTDAAVNPGNSGGPLLNLDGEVIGVNAQIRTGGSRASAGVGFAIPSNTVRRVAPVLIESGVFRWPWLGVEGTDLNLIIAEANDLDTQQGAYIDAVTRNGPADEAGLRGSTGSAQVEDFEVPVGGDVVVAANGDLVNNFDDLLVAISSRQPGDMLDLTIIRDGQRQEITVELAARPASLGQ